MNGSTLIIILDQKPCHGYIYLSNNAT